MSPLLDAILEFVGHATWGFDHGLIEIGDLVRRAGYQDHDFRLWDSTETKVYEFVVRVSDRSDCVIFTSRLDTIVPEDRRSPAAEYLCRTNFGLSIGNFEMDFTTGQVFFRTSVPVTDALPDQRVLEALVLRHMQTTDIHFSQLMKLTFVKDVGAVPIEKTT